MWARNVCHWAVRDLTPPLGLHPHEPQLLEPFLESLISMSDVEDEQYEEEEEVEEPEADESQEVIYCYLLFPYSISSLISYFPTFFF